MGSGPDLALGGLGPRERALQQLKDSARHPLDLLVVGGGITGAGVALDAVSRGMKVGLVERFDFASGTSSKSSKLVHGGLRYLEQRELRLVREASTERELLNRLAPHLVQPAPFVIPISNRWRRAMFGVGLWTYDALASFKNIKVHRYLDIAETERLVPPLPKGKLQGGFMFYDNKTDDVRLVMEILIQARRYGAAIVNHAPLTHLESGEKMCSAQVQDTVGQEPFEVRARRVVVAAGVWSDSVEALTGGARDEPRLRPSKGIHLVFRRETLRMGDAAAFIPDAARKRMLFVIPWLDAVLVGTTDTDYEGSLDAPMVEEHDRQYCLDALNASFETSLTEDDIAGAFAGLRPLVKGKAGATADLSRRHALYDIAPGVIGITGGKLTTYRRMSSDTVDRVAAELGEDTRSKTRHIRLGSSNVAALLLAVERRAGRLGLSSPTITNLVRCYGDRALEVLDLAEQGGTEELVPGFPFIEVEATYAARAEMVQHLSDFLARRTRLSLIDSEAGIGSTSRAPDVLGRELKWSSDAVDREVRDHRSAIEHERGLGLHPAVQPAGAG